MTNKKTLTDSNIRNLKIPDKRTEIYDKVVDGMILRITKTGHKSFALRYWYDNQSKQYTIGKYGDITLADARKKAKDLKGLINDGFDPTREKQKRREQRRDVLFRELADRFREIHMPSLRETTRSEYDRIIDNELIPAFGSLPVKDIVKADVIALLDNKAIKQGSPTMANRIRARFHSIFEFAISRDIVQANPVTSVKRYASGETRRDRFYSEVELRAIWDAIEQQDEPSRSVLKMLLITGQRSKETRHMRWDDVKGDVWIIPAELSKSKRQHDVPLSNTAIEIIEALRPLTGDSEYVFNSPQLENKPVEWIKRSVKSVKNLSGVKDFRLHDLRRTSATYMAKIGTDRTVLGKVLNHKGLAGDGQVTAIYDRHSYLNEKRIALQRWADHLQQILTGEPAKIHKIGG